MNPRHRRLLIPGLLIALLIVVVVASLVDKADAAVDAAQVSRMDDPRITESSGLVVSRAHDDLVYTVNDSGNASIVFAVQTSTGRTVGTATPGVEFVDVEALSIDRAGTLWIADTGDNDEERSDVALYSMPEFGPTDVDATVEQFPLTFPDGPRDVEALVVHPRTDEKFLLTKGLLGGDVYAVPQKLVANRPNELALVDGNIPGVITDAAFTPDGAYVVARDYVSGKVLDAATWQSVGSVALPAAKQGETLAMEPAGESLLVGSEGADSPLHRVAFAAPVSSEPTAAPTTAPTTEAPPAAAGEASASADDGNGFAGWTWLWASVAVALLAGVGFVITRRR